METTNNSNSTIYSNENEINNHQTLCRLCGNNTQNFINIFNDDGLKRKLSVKISSCLQFRVSINDVLSTIICITCCKILDDFYKFFEKSTEVQIYLQNLHELSLYATETKQNEKLECKKKKFSKTNKREKSVSENFIKLKKESNNKKITKLLQNYSWTCTLCDIKDLNSINNLHEHYKSIHNDTPPIYKCIHCDRHYNKYRSFTKHFLLHENPKTFECDICGKNFNLKSSLISHGFVHTNDRPYTCTVCQKTFKSTATLSVHEKCHLPEEIKTKFNCQICEKIFSSKKSLENHNKMHLGAKNYMCEICGKAFVTANSLVYHLKSHSTEKNYQCSTCGSAFRTERLMKKHSIVHSLSKPHCCGVCKKTFRERSTLIAHTRIHTGEMPYSCTDCGKKFRFAGILTVHRRIHTGERPYTCSKCERTFTNWANLNKHNRRIHNKSKNKTEENNIAPPSEKTNDIIQ